MGMLAEQADHVIGVDTHRDAHSAAAIATGTGAVTAQITVAADAFGYKRLLRFARRHARTRRVWAIESSGSFGAGLTMFLLARRILALEAEANDLESELEQIVERTVPELLAETGVGPISAAQLYCSWSPRGRLRHDGAFAMLGGAAPIPASSGQTIRYRLNRAGDRQLNCALHTIVLSRLQHDPATRAYAARRLAEARPHARSSAASSASCKTRAGCSGG